MRKKLLVLSLAVVLTVSASCTIWAESEESIIEPGVSVSTLTTETEEDISVQPAALLSGIGYRPGYLNEKGWFSEFFELEFRPADDHTVMSLEINDAFQDYYKRNGEEYMIASSEMVAAIDADDIIQLTAETNAKNESAESILSGFADLENMKDMTEAEEAELGGLSFLTVGGTIDGKAALIGVYSSKKGAILALKTTFESLDKLKTLFSGFAPLSVDDMKSAGFEPSEKYMASISGSGDDSSSEGGSDSAAPAESDLEVPEQS